MKFEHWVIITDNIKGINNALKKYPSERPSSQRLMFDLRFLREGTTNEKKWKNFHKKKNHLEEEATSSILKRN